MKSILMSMLAVAALASCNKEGAGDVPQVDPNYTSAYLSVGISMPQAERSSRAVAPGTDPGTNDETAVKTVYVVGFKHVAPFAKVGVYKIESNSLIGAETPFVVSPDVKKIFVVINPTPKVLAAINTASSYSLMNNAIVDEAKSNASISNGFMMTSAGKLVGDMGLTDVTPMVAASESTDDLNKAKADAAAAKVAVSVDRTVAKVALLPFTPSPANVENGEAEVTGWQLNTTTKEYFPYAELIAYGFSSEFSKYRVDPTWGVLPAANFNWLHNSNNPSEPADDKTINWLTPAVGTGNAVAYCLENTMDKGSSGAQNYNNTTKVTIKAKFAPVGVVLGKSWYRVGGVIKTLQQLKDDYKAAEDILVTDAANAAALKITKAFDAFKAKLGMTSVPFADLSETAMDAVQNGGYKAATAAGCMIEYFQKSVCYYNVNIMHDARVEAKGLGRWGVLRNNSYSLTVNKITQAGSPYIPDPTDDAIEDPNNPDKENPEDNDKASAFISVSITINQWTSWDQSVDL